MNTINEIISVACEDCGGAGFIFWGNKYEYDIETCDCIKAELYSQGFIEDFNV